MSQTPCSFRQVPLPAGVSGRLLLHSMPGRHESMEEVHQAIAHHGITVVVCLTPCHEIRKKSPAYAHALATGVPWTHVHLPVPDFDVPEDPEAFYKQAEAITGQLRAGRRALVHCGAGIGRTGTFACLVLVALGLSQGQAAAAVRQAKARPETPEQEELVRAYACSLARGPSP